MKISVPVRLPESPVERQLLKSMVDAFDAMSIRLLEDVDTILLGDLAMSDLALVKSTSGEDQLLIKASKPPLHEFHHKMYTRVRDGKVQTIMAHGSAPIEPEEVEELTSADIEEEPNPHTPVPPKPTPDAAPSPEKKPLDPPQYYWDENKDLRYGIVSPERGDVPLTPEETAKRIQIFRPSPFILQDNIGQEELYKFMADNPQISGMSKQDVEFLKVWKDVLEPKYRKIKDIKKDQVLDQGDLQGLAAFILHNLVQDPLNAEERARIGQHVDRIAASYKQTLAHPESQAFLKKYMDRIAEQMKDRVNKFEATQQDFVGLGPIFAGDHDELDRSSHLMVLSGLASMGFLYKHSRGAEIVIDADLLPGAKDSLFDKERAFKRMSNQQLMLSIVAASLACSFDKGSKRFGINSFYTYRSEALRQATTELEDRLGDEGVANDLTDKLRSLAKQLAPMLEEANNLADPAVRHAVLTGGRTLKGGLASAKDLDEHYQKIQNARAEGLAAQRDDTDPGIPDSMKEGKWGGKQINAKSGKPWAPFTHQKNAINWMKKVMRGILALGVGMGKTSTVVWFSEHVRQEWAKLGKKHTSIVVLPPTLMYQWPSEIRAFAPDAKVLMLPTDISKEARKALLRSSVAKEADYIIMSRSSFGADKDKKMDREHVAYGEDVGGLDEDLIDALNGIEGSVFVDEAHDGGYKTGGDMVRGKDDQMLYKAKGVVHETMKRICQNRQHVFGMTATPMPNDPLDLHALGEVFCPGAFGDQSEWSGKLQDVSYDAHTGYDVKNWASIAKLKKQIAPFILSRNIDDPIAKQEMGAETADLDTTESEDVEASDIPCPKTGRSQADWLRSGGIVDQVADAKLKALNERRLKEGKKALDGRNALMFTKGQAIMLRRQAAISPALLDPNYEGESPKIDRMVEKIREHFGSHPGRKHHEDGTPISVFSSFPQKAYPLLKKKLLEAGIHPERIGIIDQSASPEERAKLQDMYNAGHIKILLLGQKSGGAGLNLQHSSHKQYNLDDPWTPEGKEQSIGRQKRVGQKAKEVQSISFRVRGSYDGAMEVGLNKKQVMVSALLGDLDVDALAASKDPKKFIEEHERAMIKMTGRVKGDAEYAAEQADLQKKKISGYGTTGLDHLWSNGAEDEEADSELAEVNADIEEVLSGKQKNKPSAASRAAEYQARFTPNVTPEAQQQAQQHMPELASSFDRPKVEREWELENQMRLARNTFSMHVAEAKMHDENKFPDEAIKARKKASKILNEYQRRFTSVSSLLEHAKTLDTSALTPEQKTVHEKELKQWEGQLKEYRNMFPEVFSDPQSLQDSLVTKDTEGAVSKDARREIAKQEAATKAKQVDELHSKDPTALTGEDLTALHGHLGAKETKQFAKHQENLSKLKGKAKREYMDRLEGSLDPNNKAFNALVRHSHIDHRKQALDEVQEKNTPKPPPVAKPQATKSVFEQMAHIEKHHPQGMPLHPEDALKVINHGFATSASPHATLANLHKLDPSYELSHVQAVYSGKARTGADLYKLRYGGLPTIEGKLSSKDLGKKTKAAGSTLSADVLPKIGKTSLADLDTVHKEIREALTKRAKTKKTKPAELKAALAVLDHHVAEHKEDLLRQRDGVPIGEGDPNMMAVRPKKGTSVPASTPAPVPAPSVKPPVQVKAPETQEAEPTPPKPVLKPRQGTSAPTKPTTQASAPKTPNVVEGDHGYKVEEATNIAASDDTWEVARAHFDAMEDNIKDIRVGKLDPVHLDEEFKGVPKAQVIKQLESYVKAGQKAVEERQKKEASQVKTPTPKPKAQATPAPVPPKPKGTLYKPHHLGMSIAEDHAKLIPDDDERAGSSVFTNRQMNKIVGALKSKWGASHKTMDGLADALIKPAYSDPSGKYPYTTRRGRSYLLDALEALHKRGVIQEAPQDDPPLISWGKLSAGKPLPTTGSTPSGMPYKSVAGLLNALAGAQKRHGSFEDFADFVMKQAWSDPKDPYTRRKGVAYLRDVLDDLAKNGYIKGHKP